MEAAIDTDPDLAIGTAREFVESISKAILPARLIEFNPRLEVYSLVQAAADELRASSCERKLRPSETASWPFSDCSETRTRADSILMTLGASRDASPGRDRGPRPSDRVA
jgi:hypothetical protein